MAKYTELFADYVERGGSLPPSFSNIEGFEEIFKAYYCDKEIGFETETLFFMKLSLYADTYIPAYAEKIGRLASAWLNFDAPIKVKYYTDNTTFDGGATKQTTTDLPVNGLTAEPSIVNKGDAYKNTNNIVHDEKDTGTTATEAIERVKFLNDKVSLLIFDLLNEFKPCFMGIY